jgi:alkylation response protein AidB-like acyl-CoA dehydrogenase
MYLRLEAARLLVYQAAWLGQQGKSVLAEAAAANREHAGAARRTGGHSVGSGH